MTLPIEEAEAVIAAARWMLAAVNDALRDDSVPLDVTARLFRASRPCADALARFDSARARMLEQMPAS